MLGAERGDNDRIAQLSYKSHHSQACFEALSDEPANSGKNRTFDIAIHPFAKLGAEAYRIPLGPPSIVACLRAISLLYESYLTAQLNFRIEKISKFFTENYDVSLERLAPARKSAQIISKQ